MIIGNHGFGRFWETPNHQYIARQKQTYFLMRLCTQKLMCKKDCRTKTDYKYEATVPGDVITLLVRVLGLAAKRKHDNDAYSQAQRQVDPAYHVTFRSQVTGDDFGFRLRAELGRIRARKQVYSNAYRRVRFGHDGDFFLVRACSITRKQIGW